MKKLRNAWGKIIFLTLSLSLLLTSVALAATIKVGIFNLGNFQYFDSKGVASGYNVEYLKKIAERTKWDYEFVRCNNWVEATKLLEEGKIDLLAPAQHTTELDAKFSYGAYQMGGEFAVVYALAERKDLIFEDYAKMGTLTFGGVQPSSFTRNFILYGKEHGFATKLRIYNNTTELFRALHNKEVDGIVTNIMFANKKVKILARFAPTPVYYISTRDKIELLHQVDEAMYNIQLNDPTFSAELTDKYFPQYQNNQFSFQEDKLIKSLPTLNVGFFPNQAPNSYLGANKEFQGFSRQILDLMAKESGLSFNYVALGDGSLSTEELLQKKIDIVAGISYDAISAARQDLILSDNYATIDRILVCRKDYDFKVTEPGKFALPKWNSNFGTIAKGQYPQIEVVTYPSLEACLDAIKEGKADFIADNRFALERLLAKPQYEDLRILPIHSFSDKICLGLVDIPSRKDSAINEVGIKDVLTILNKGLHQVPKSELSHTIVDATAAAAYRASFGDFLYKFKYAVVLIGLLLATIFYIMYKNALTKEKQNELLAHKNLELADAVSQADAANRAKSQFLARMSHEIRTPMNAVVGLTSIAKAHVGDKEKMGQYLTKIATSSRVLLNIINDVLDMSAIESSKLKIANNNFNVKEVLLGISTIYYSQCKNKGINFEMITADITHETLIGDSLRLNQILLNLVSNAYKFTEKGGTITIKAEEKSTRNGKAFFTFTVQDTGCGMNEQMQERLFKPFEQASAQKAQKYGGSGLGLSIAKNLVQLMDGAVKVTSSEGKGTTFTVDLPFALPDEEFIRDTHDIKDIKVMVIDDDEQTLAYTKIILDRIGVQYDVCLSGEEALNVMGEASGKGEGYDVCFIDWKMPNLNGLDVTKRIRQYFSKETVIIIVSAYDLSEVEDEALAAGANMFIPKPLFQSTVFDTLMEISHGKFVKNTSKPESLDLTGHRVLLAEDNDINREIATELMDMIHLEVDPAVNGQEALDKFKAAPKGYYDVILMDVQMPTLNGHEATKAIRALERDDAKIIPIYAMTANAFTEDITAALNAGMNGHIAKPIDVKLLYEILAQCCK